ncbi:hypothetical protein Ancab_036179 [Ancistrocladus abbreviatus]
MLNFPFLVHLNAIILLITIPSIHGQRYDICSNLYSCGKILNVGCPFWGDGRPEWCGEKEFKLICLSNSSYPFIQIGTTPFLVRNIDTSNHSITIVQKADFMFTNNTSCPPAHLMSTTLNESLFDISQSIVNLTIHYTCSSNDSRVNSSSSSSSSSMTCPYYSYNSANTTMSSGGSVTVYESGVKGDGCNARVSNVLVNSRELEKLKRNRTTLWEVLNEGFEVEYKANFSACRGCNLSGGVCGSSNQSLFHCFCRHGHHQPDFCGPLGHSRWRVKVGIGVGAAFCSITVTSILFLFYLRHHRKHNCSSTLLSRNTSSYPSNPKGLEDDGIYGVDIFTHTELEVATNNFDDSNRLGDGGFGTVYHGILVDGREVAIKRLYENNSKRVQQFRNEIQILTRLRHKNLVTLYGCTSHYSHELLLVYEYIANGTVADHLHGDRAKQGALQWPTRLRIAIETASALMYLHASDIIHRDIKTNNILLDEKFSVKVADFGMSRLFPLDATHVSTSPQGTPGYLDPEYHECYQLTEKSDVFSFGVVLVELISSKPAVDISRSRHDINLSTMAINRIQNNMLHELIDSSLGFESDCTVRDAITAVAGLAFRCLQSDRDLRPSMEELLQGLIIIRGDHEQGNIMDKAEVVDIPADDMVSLKNDLLPYSPPTERNNATI